MQLVQYPAYYPGWASVISGDFPG